MSKEMSFIYIPTIDFHEAINPYVNEVSIDVLGNIIAHKKGIGPKIMLIAHHDVVRFMISHIDENGYIRADIKTEMFQFSLQGKL